MRSLLAQNAWAAHELCSVKVHEADPISQREKRTKANEQNGDESQRFDVNELFNFCKCHERVHVVFRFMRTAIGFWSIDDI